LRREAPNTVPPLDNMSSMRTQLTRTPVCGKVGDMFRKVLVI